MTERRAVERKSGHELYLEHVAIINEKNLVIAAQAYQIDGLIREIGVQRDAVRRATSHGAHMKGGDAVVQPSPRGGDSVVRSGRRPAVLASEGRVQTDPMNSPLNPETDPPPFAAVRR